MYTNYRLKPILTNLEGYIHTSTIHIDVLTSDSTISSSVQQNGDQILLY